MKEQKIKVGQVVPGVRRKSGFEFRITLIYLLIGFTWIIFSDAALDILVPDDSLLTKFQTYKGSFYVIMTALVLFILVRKQMRKIREQQLNFESMFHTISDAVIISTPAREIVLSNKGVETTFGYTQEEILGKSAEILYAKAGEFRKSGDLVYGKVSEKNSATYISYYKDKQGKVFPGETHGTRLFDSKGVWIGNVAIIRNISERLDFIERIENALESAKKSEQSFRSILDNMLEGCQIIGTDWIYQYANHAASAFCAFPREELPGKRFDEVWKKIAPDGFFTAIGHCMADGVSVRGEYKFSFPDGQQRWYDTRIQKNGDGIFILTVDFTKRRQAEEKMSENEFKFRRIYEDGPIGMARVDRAFRFINVNTSFCRMLGYPELVLQGMTFKEVTHPEDVLKDLPELEKLAAGEIPVYKTEKRYLHRNGGVVRGSLTVRANFDSDGQFMFFLAIIENINDR